MGSVTDNTYATITDVQSTDKLLIVDDPDGSPTVKRATVEEVVTAVSPASHSHDASSDLTGLLPLANGGMGADFSGIALGNLIVGTGSGVAGLLASGTTGQVLTAQADGSSAWATAASGVTDHGALTGLGDDDHTIYILVDGSRAFTGNQSAGGNKITSLATPTADTDAANKAYVDAAVAGLKWKPSVRVATTANGALSTAFENGDTVDGITLSTGDRILLKDQSTGSQNGIYVVQASGAPVRADDMATSSTAAGVVVFVEEGTTNGDKSFVCTTDSGSDTVGTDSLAFATFGGSTTDHNSLTNLTTGDPHTQYVPVDGSRGLSGNWDAGSFEIRSQTFQSDVTTGTAPLIVASTTLVENLNADKLDGIEGNELILKDGSEPLTGDWDAGSFQIRAQTFQSDVTTGTAPFTVASTTLVSNLNADRLDGNHASAFALASHTHSTSDITSGTFADARIAASNVTQHQGAIDHGSIAGLTGDHHTIYLLAGGTRALTANWDAGSFQIRAEQFYSDVSTGTPPLIVLSTTLNTNFNADLLDGQEGEFYSALPRGYLSGLTLSNNTTDSDHDIDIAVGECRDSADGDNLALSSTMVKRIDATWAAGTGNGGMFTGSVAADTWYHFFLIKKDLGGSIDAGFDTDVDAANIPTGYTAYRRLGSVLTDGSSNIEPFHQFEHDFFWDTQVEDHSAVSLGTTATNYTMSVPPDLNVRWYGGVFAYKGATNIYLYMNSPETADIAVPNLPSNSTHNATTAGGIAYPFTMGEAIRTNTSGQIRARSSHASTVLHLMTRGWRDERIV